MKIIAFSSICCDYFPEKKITVPGGNSLNFAVQSKRFADAEVALAGFIGTDNAASEIVKLCRQNDIDTRFLIRLKGNTASNRLYHTPGGERYSKPGEWQNGVKDNGIFTEDAWNFILSRDLIATTCNDKHIDELIQRRKKHNFISVDFMHFDSVDLITKYLPHIDIAFTSPAVEALESLKNLSFYLNKPLVAMLGSEGSIAYYQGNEFKQKALQINKIIDTTGCGDAYQAAFCNAIIRSEAPEEAMKLATDTATEVLKGFGGIYLSE